MKRRNLLGMMGAAAFGSGRGGVRVAVMTHAGGPHLSAYVAGLAETAEAESVVWCDASGATEASARKGLGPRLRAVYRDLPEMLAREKPALTMVVMEAALAPPAIAAALEAGSHVMAEKPACVRLEDFEELCRKADARSRQLMLALANRTDPVMAAARRLIQDGKIGSIYGAELHTIADQTRLTRPGYRDAWYAQKSRGGGGHLIWLGIHWIDLATYLTGLRVREVTALTANVGGQPLDVEDAAVLAFRFDNGALGALTSAYYLDKGKQLVIRFWGSEGWMHLDRDRTPPLAWYTRKHGLEHLDAVPGQAGYTPFVQAVVRACAGREPPPLTTADSLHALRVVFAAYRSAETRAAQTLAR
jgi:predicted dehydrogenase